MKRIYSIKFIMIITFVIGTSFINAQVCKPDNTKSLSKSNIYIHSQIFNVNNISSWMSNNGEYNIEPNGNSGFEFPRLSDKTAIFQSGFLWGGKVNGEVRVGGSMYNAGLVGGRILEDGTPQDPNNNNVRIYKVRRDYKTADLSLEAEDENITVEQAYINYELDWNQWPAEDGAPYEDIDNDGTYDPSIDVPGVTGADQTLWFVSNDLDVEVTNNLYGSLPLGLEIQVTTWGYNSESFLQNVMFKKYIIINKSQNDINEMYTCIWTDPDIGDPLNDLSGCDTLLNLGYAYNGHNYDSDYGDAPAAVGFQFLKGPKDNTGDLLSMTSFGYFSCGDMVFHEPWNGSYEEGALRWYNWFQGLIGDTGQPIINPIDGKETKFAVAGDPLTGIGWLGNTLRTCGDTKFFMSSGPFSLKAGESQEITFAQTAALGKDRLNAVRIIKFYANLLKDYYDDLSYFISNTKQFTTSIVSSTSDINGIQIEWSDISNENIGNGYSFEGYNVYQLYSEEPLIENGLKLATFDVQNGIQSIQGIKMNEITGDPELGIVQKGNDTGLQFSYLFEEDKILNELFIRGKEYYFGISPYYYNSLEAKSIEGKITPIKIVYDDGIEGPTYNQIISTNKINGNNGLKVIPIVKNPSELKEHGYEVSVEEINDELKWKLTDNTTNTILASGMDVYDYPPLGSQYLIHPIIDGIEIQVYKLRPGIENEGKGIIEIKYAGEPIPQEGWDETGYEYGGNTVWRDPNWEGNIGIRDRFYVSTNASDLRSFGTSNYDFELRFSDSDDNFALWRIPYVDEKNIARVPFEIWNIGSGTPKDQSDDFRMVPFLHVSKSDNLISWRYNVNTDMNLNYPASDKIYFYNPIDETPGDFGYNQFANVCKLSGGAGAQYNFLLDNDPSLKNANTNPTMMLLDVMICDYDKDGNPPPAGTVIRFNMNKALTLNDKVRFYSPTADVSGTGTSELPIVYSLEQNYPNPFNPTTKIKFSLPEAGIVKLDIYNILGQKVASLLNQQMNPGIYEKDFNVVNLSSGVYIYRLQINNKFVDTKKMILLK